MLIPPKEMQISAQENYAYALWFINMQDVKAYSREVGVSGCASGYEQCTQRCGLLL